MFKISVAAVVFMASSLSFAADSAKRKPSHAAAQAHAYVCGQIAQNGDLVIAYRKYQGSNPDVSNPTVAGVFGVKQVSVDLFEGKIKLTAGHSYCFEGIFSYAEASDQPSLESFKSMVDLN